MQTTTTMAKTYVLGCVSWFFPARVSFSATPNPLMAMTEMEPTSEQMEMYTNGSRVPYRGET